MRLIRMSRRSVYRGSTCLHCHKPITLGRAAFVSTLYITGWKPYVRTYSMVEQAKRLGADMPNDVELRIRFAYHRRCIEGVLERGPVDPEVEMADFDQYRAELLDRLGIDEVL